MGQPSTKQSVAGRGAARQQTAFSPVERNPENRSVEFELLGEWGSSRGVSLSCDTSEMQRVGIVSTVYRAQDLLEIWCGHHLAAGVAHLIVVFDHMEEVDEAALAARLVEACPADRLTVWSGAEVAERVWPEISRDPRLADLVRLAEYGASAEAVSARQALNATAALHAAREGELGGIRLDWMLHLDVDELFHLEGSDRGGASLSQHFSAVSQSGLELIRYVNHELLLPWRPRRAARFKVNPWQVAARDGPGKLADLEQRLGRSYFSAYGNGKSAVAVAAGKAAAGVHSWFLDSPATADVSVFVAGPSVLHLHCASPAAFREKFLAIADAPSQPGRRLFEPLPVEVAAVTLIEALRREGASPDLVDHELNGLYDLLMVFDDEHTALLEEAGLLFSPVLGRLRCF